MATQTVEAINETGWKLAGKHLILVLGQEANGVEVLTVREIIRMTDITSAPQMPASFSRSAIRPSPAAAAVVCDRCRRVPSLAEKPATPPDGRSCSLPAASTAQATLRALSLPQQTSLLPTRLLRRLQFVRVMMRDPRLHLAAGLTW